MKNRKYENFFRNPEKNVQTTQDILLKAFLVW